MSSHRVARGTISAAVFTVLIAAGSGVRAETKVVFNKLVEEVKIGGDLRLRQENFDNSGTAIDRQRQRMRLRVGADFKLPKNVAVKTRFTTTEPTTASSQVGGDPISGNQTLTGNASKKAFLIDLAFVEWKPGNAKFMGGKSTLPFWTQASSDVMWDGDYTPEGLSEGWEGLVGPVGMFAAAGQYALQERSGSLNDAYLFSEQAGVELKLPLQSRIRTALAHHEFVNVHQGALTNATNPAGVRYSILEWTSALNLWLGSIPVSLQGTLLKNNAATKVALGGNPTPDERDQAVHAGVVVGKASAKKLQVAGFYKEIDRDAAFPGITDSDFPNTTNAKGWIGWIAYGINDFMTAQIKHFDAERKIVAAGAADGSVNRTQFDLSFKF